MMRLSSMATAVLVMVLAAGTARAGDPLLDFFTIETEHFVIHYHTRLASAAKRLAMVAERAHKNLAPALDHKPAEKTLVVLVDDTDSANGFAGVLPRNAIQLFATAPSAFTELDDHDDWLYGLVTHEYTHILHLDTLSGLPAIYNRIFGKTWAPNQIMPRWIIEGVATYEESKKSSGGRNRGSRFEQFIRIARHDEKDLRLDQVTGAPRQFPRGNAVYVYGSHFLRYVFDRFGEDALREMSHSSGAHPVPYAINRQIAKVTGKPFTQLYDDWKGYLRDRYGMQEMAAERRGMMGGGRALTTTGEGNFFPRYSDDGKELYWLQSNGYREPRIRAVPVGSDTLEPRNVIRADAMGSFDVMPDGSLVFEQTRVFRRDYNFQDLMLWDARTKTQIRLTTGARARDPSLSPDGRRITFSMNQTSESVLAITDAVPDAPISVVWKGQERDQVYTPAWSPDGKRIAFAAWRRGGKRDILIVELASGAVTEVTNDRAVDSSPAWSADSRYVYFDSDRTSITNIFAYDTTDGSTWQVTNVLGGAFQPAASHDGTRLAFSNAVPRGGYDLYEITLDRASWLPAQDYIDDRPPPTAVRDDEAKVTAPRKYRPLEALAPRIWAAQLSATGTDTSVTLQTDGSDPFGLHSYQLALGTNLSTGDLNIGAVYAYSRWRFPIRLAASRTLSERGGFRVDGVGQTYKQEDWSATLSTSIPFEARPWSSWTMSFDYDLDYFRLVDAPMLLPDEPDPNMRVPVVPLTNYRQAGLGARVSYSSVRGVTFGVGPQYGFDASLGLRIDHEALGATFDAITVSYSTNTFRRLWGKTPVIAARLAGSFRAGDLVRPGGFALGGVPSQDIVNSIVNSVRTGVTGYLRGYEPRAIFGNQFHLLNLEYRQELLQIERGLATLPIYFRRLTFAALSDIGAAFETDLDIERNVRYSVGGALRLDAFFGYFVPGTFEIGYSRGLTSDGVGEGWFLLTGSL
jgi:Tol biopolymer transport system component